MAAVAVHGGDIGAGDAVVLEALVEGSDAHRFHALGGEIADRIVDHGGGDSRSEAEAVGQIRSYIELAAADVDVAFGRFAKRYDAGVEAMNQRAQREEIQRAIRRDGETVVRSCRHENLTVAARRARSLERWIAGFKPQIAARAVPEMKNFDEVWAFVHAVVNQDRSMYDPTDTRMAFDRATDEREGLE